MVPTVEVVRTRTRTLPEEEGLVDQVVAFDRREDADTDSPELPVGIGPAEAELESSLADGSHEVDRPDLDPAVVLALGVRRVHSGDSCLVVADAGLKVDCHCTIAEVLVAADLDLVVADSYLVADVVQLQLEEMCKLVEVRDQGLLVLPLHNQRM